MTSAAMKQILNSITVICDTREHEADGNGSNIIAYLEGAGVPYIKRALKFGDYSFEVNGESYENQFVIERKANLTELSSNIAQNRERFEAELQRSKDTGSKLVLMIENGSYKGIIEHKYRTNLNEKAFLATILTYRNRYGIDIQFIPEQYSGLFIHMQFYYYLRERLKEAEAS